MVLNERKRLAEQNEDLDSKETQAPVDSTDTKIAEMLAASTERVEQMMAAQKAREAIAEAELQQMAEKTRERDARAREAEQNFLRNKEEAAAKRGISKRAAEVELIAQLATSLSDKSHEPEKDS